MRQKPSKPRSIAQRATCTWLLPLLAVIAPRPAPAAELEPISGEFQISGVDGFLGAPSVAFAADGGLAVAWIRLEACGFRCPDNESFVRGRRFDGQGRPLGGEVDISGDTTGGAINPVLRRHPDGGFVILWKVETEPWSPVLRRLDDNVVPVDRPLRIAPRVPGETFGGTDAGYALAVSPSGEIGVAWDSSWFFSLIEGQRFSADLRPRGRRFVVNTSSGFLEYPSLAAVEGGGFVAAWSRFAPFSAGEQSTQARRFRAGGRPAGLDFTPSSEPTKNRFYTDPVVVGGRQGGYTILWHVRRPAAFLGIRGRRYDSRDEPVSGEFRLDAESEGGFVGHLTAAADNAGRTIAVWVQPDHDAQTDVFVRVVDVDGLVGAPPARVNDVTVGGQYDPAVAVGPAGEIAIVWVHDSIIGERTIRGRFYRLVP